MKVRTLLVCYFATVLCLSSLASNAQTAPRIEIEMDATRIRSNQELPKLLYIVPWQDTELSGSLDDRKIVIPDLFSDYYQPLLPNEVMHDDAPENK